MSAGSPVVPPDVVALADYERHARSRMAPDIWAYVAGAGADGWTRRWNREAFDRIRLAGRVLTDMRGASTRSSLFGLDLEFPVIVAPVAFQRLAHPDGESATALGVSAARSVMTVSTQSSVALETVAAASTRPLLYQLYMQTDRADTLRLVRRAEAASFAAIMVTVDAPVSGVRNEEQRAGFRLPVGVAAVDQTGMAIPVARAGPGESPVFMGLLDNQPRWEDVEWLRGETRLPLLLKGIVDHRDAMRAIASGIDGIVVSNHGGRTLDTLPATIEALPRIVATVDGRVPVLVDGGIRRGTDVLKCLALGASAVMVGQPVMHALAVAGAVGVAHMLTILRAELEAAMALTGCRTLADIDGSVLWDGAPPS